MQIPVLIRRVLDNLLGPRGHLSRELRIAATDYAAGGAGAKRAPTVLPPALKSYADKVCHAPYKVVDGDITALAQAGLSEDQVFELTAFGAALGRFEKTLELLTEDPP